MQEVRIQIARSSAHVEEFEVRVIGPGGWRTSISRASLSACRHDARAWANVLKAKIEEALQ